MIIKNLRIEYLENPVVLDELNPRFSWELESDERDKFQSAYRVTVFKAGEIVWDSGKVHSDSSCQIKYRGNKLEALSDYSWQVKVWDENNIDSDCSDIATFSTGFMNNSNWSSKWIQAPCDIPKNAQYYRHEFTIPDKKIVKATLYASAKGIFETGLNGKKAGDIKFAPGWTDYRKRIHYMSYDVSSSLQTGKNAMFAILARGWHNGFVGFENKFKIYGDHRAFIAELHIKYEDGSADCIASDESWYCKKMTAFLEAEFLFGEKYDARLDDAGWKNPGFNYDEKWMKAELEENSEEPLLEAYPSVPVTEVKTLDVVKSTEVMPGAKIYDFGQNFAGVVRLKTEGPAGTIIRIRHGEMLYSDGSLYTENLRAADSVDIYTKATDNPEVYEPKFTFHGFRYAEISSTFKLPDNCDVKAVVIASDTPSVGKFECSDPMINQLYSNIIWTQRSNFLEVPTDCPQRDERLGWTGDAQAYVKTAAFNMDISAFYTKWLKDLSDAQYENGAFPNVAPNIIKNGRGDAGWGDAGVICPRIIYEFYNDKDILEKYYPNMSKWIEYLDSMSENCLRYQGDDHQKAFCFGDWLSVGSETPKEIVMTAFYAYAAEITAKTAEILGKKDDAEKYCELCGKIKKAFREKFVSSDDKIHGDTQTAYILAIKFKIYKNKEQFANFAEKLVKRIEEKNWHLSVGFLGVPYILPVLSEIGREDIAYRLLMNKTYPSWGYSVVNGATTIWERWNGWTKDDGFGNSGMNSYSHYAYGSVGEWFFTDICGIKSLSPGYKNLQIKPLVTEKMDFADAVYKSINGEIRSSWKHLEDKALEFKLKIPVNCRAVFIPPADSLKKIEFEGEPLSKSGLDFSANTKIEIKLNSGIYEFIINK